MEFPIYSKTIFLYFKIAVKPEEMMLKSKNTRVATRRRRSVVTWVYNYLSSPGRHQLSYFHFPDTNLLNQGSTSRLVLYIV